MEACFAGDEAVTNKQTRAKIEKLAKLQRALDGQWNKAEERAAKLSDELRILEDEILDLEDNLEKEHTCRYCYGTGKVQ